MHLHESVLNQGSDSVESNNLNFIDKILFKMLNEIIILPQGKELSYHMRELGFGGVDPADD